MIDIFRDNPWLFVVLGALCVPLFGIILGGWSQWLAYRQRRAALDAIKAYAQQGKDAPAELLSAASGPRWGRPWHDGDPNETEEQRAARFAEWRGRWRTRRRHQPFWQWRRAIMFTAIAGGLYLAYRLSDSPEAHRGFLLAAAIVGCIAAAQLLIALVASFNHSK